MSEDPPPATLFALLDDEYARRILAVLCFCGLVLAAMGVVTIRDGRSQSNSTGLC